MIHNWEKDVLKTQKIHNITIPKGKKKTRKEYVIANIEEHTIEL